MTWNFEDIEPVRTFDDQNQKLKKWPTNQPFFKTTDIFDVPTSSNHDWDLQKCTQDFVISRASTIFDIDHVHEDTSLIKFITPQNIIKNLQRQTHISKPRTKL